MGNHLARELVEFFLPIGKLTKKLGVEVRLDALVQTLKSKRKDKGRRGGRERQAEHRTFFKKMRDERVRKEISGDQRQEHRCVNKKRPDHALHVHAKSDSKNDKISSKIRQIQNPGLCNRSCQFCQGA